MKFNSLPFFLLLGITLLLYYNLRRTGRLIVLIAASIIFYAFWNIPLVSLIVISAVVDYTAGLSIERNEAQWKRRLFLIMSLATNLGLLGYFKYANFFVDNIRAAMGNSSDTLYLNIILPPGISFYTFQTMSYTIDVYRKKITPTRSFLRFFVYVSFFPQLVAGPIERASHLLTQFDYTAKNRFSLDNFVTGSRMIVWGMFKKVIFADYCGGLVDRVYNSPGAFDGWSALVATYAFTLQIYCDFSAYSEIARGSARLFGIDLMQNFDQPYLTTNISDFWRRWHISLSTWIRDYIYIPLGGGRCSKSRKLINLVITMLLSGLWHGAAWNFIVWGLYHGVLLLFTAVIGRRKWFRAIGERLGISWTILCWFINIHLVIMGWILFRISSFSDFGVIISNIGTSIISFSPCSLNQLLFILFTLLFMSGSHVVRKYNVFERINRDMALSTVFYTTLIVIMLLFAKGDGPQFIYFQF